MSVIIDGVNFLNNADIDGKGLPPPGAPNIMMATGGTQLKNVLEDDGIFVWKFHVDWGESGQNKIIGPEKIAVARIITCADNSRTACRSRARIGVSTRRATRSWRGWFIAKSESRIAGRSPLGQHFPAAAECAGTSFRSTKTAASACDNRARTRQTVLPLDGQPCYRQVRQYRHRLLLRRDAEFLTSASPRVSDRRQVDAARDRLG